MSSWKKGSKLISISHIMKELFSEQPWYLLYTLHVYHSYVWLKYQILSPKWTQAAIYVIKILHFTFIKHRKLHTLHQSGWDRLHHGTTLNWISNLMWNVQCCWIFCNFPFSFLPWENIFPTKTFLFQFSIIKKHKKKLFRFSLHESLMKFMINAEFYLHFSILNFHSNGMETKKFSSYIV